ncbi:DUF547 domain-containing protein [Hymenobacter qilianensis]|uniref:DUF547 domain-containing protein n=2 Tax=Hymenobacter qilianensis TaxID=1385715 RepID=A0ACB5PR11_9BACT|nr:DUF547 domain-containing protein [Hymenobacter qilianensis]QNP52005.1 DUF547 domain-containing protein [Hymenobacter qilianensis]GGF63617.1 DUF547 domain-containing protein [Hymenobacter qilianensis]
MRPSGFLTFRPLRLLTLLTALWLPLGGILAAPIAPSFTAATSAFLQKYVNADGNVNYAAIKKQPAVLNSLLQTVQSFDTKTMSAAERKAFYLNAYNLVVIGAVVERFPIASVMKVQGFFDKLPFTIAGEKMTLNELETNKLRKPYNDPRIHFALVCAAKGCPRLSREAFAAPTLDAQLSAQTKRVLTDPTFIRLNATAKKVQVSEIFKWYAADFNASGQPLIPYLNQYRAAQPIPATYAIDYYPYDWSLNTL